MLEKRRDPRYQTMGKARIIKAVKGDVYLKDISITGCCIECTANIDKISIKPEEKYKLNIRPEKAAHVGNFNIEVECKWIQKRNNSLDIGFQITVSPSGKDFQKYVDYLAYKSHVS